MKHTYTIESDFSAYYGKKVWFVAIHVDGKATQWGPLRFSRSEAAAFLPK